MQNSNELYEYTGWVKKVGPRLMAIIVSNLNRFAIFFTGRFLGKVVVKLTLKIPPNLALPRETLMSAEQAISDKLQGSVSTYLRCGGVANKQIKKGLIAESA